MALVVDVRDGPCARCNDVAYFFSCLSFCVRSVRCVDDGECDGLGVLDLSDVMTVPFYSEAEVAGVV